MRTQILFSGVDASQSYTSSVINFEQRGEWMLQVIKSGTDGNPKLYIEYSIDNAASVWSPLNNPETNDEWFDVDDDQFTVIDDRLQGKYFRVRLEPNGTTTGTITIDLGYKTYP